MSYRTKRKQGFTLVELLVTIAIISLLITMLMPSLSKARELAKRASCGSNLRGMYLAAYCYQADNNGVLPGLGGANAMASGYAWSYWDSTTGKGSYSFRNFYSTYMNVANDRVTYKGTAPTGAYPDYVGFNLRNGRPKNLICPGFIEYANGGNRMNYVWYSGSCVANNDTTGPILEYGVTLNMLEEAAFKKRTSAGIPQPPGSIALFGDKIFRNAAANTGKPEDTCHLFNASVDSAGNLVPEGGNVVNQDGSVTWLKYVAVNNRYVADSFVIPNGGYYGSNQSVPFNCAIIDSPASGTVNMGGVSTTLYGGTNVGKVMMGSSYTYPYTAPFQ